MDNYAYTLTSGKSAAQMYKLLLNVKEWWSGLFNETISGSSEKVDDEFSFSAGDGMHFSKQKLIELIPNKKIVWRVTESRLSFLTKPNEWENTELVFNISESDGETKITFTHQGLQPQVEL